jgi:hypothetical protein
MYNASNVKYFYIMYTVCMPHGRTWQGVDVQAPVPVAKQVLALQERMDEDKGCTVQLVTAPDL